MKIAIIGSRNLVINDFEKYIPDSVTEIVSGGAKGIDSCIETYSEKKSIPIKVFYPEYSKYGKSAPLKRNLQIIDYSDLVIAFWDGMSKGTKHVIDECKKKRKPIIIYVNGVRIK